MYAHAIRSWRLLGHSRRCLCPLPSLKGFTLELLEVSYVCTHAAAVRSAWTAVAGRGWLIGGESYSTLGLFWRTLLSRCLFVPLKRRSNYRGYVKIICNLFE